MTIAPGVIPRIDPSVEYVGVSKLRKLNSDDMKKMEKTYVLQENDTPIAVLLTYEKFLVLQEHIDALAKTISILSNKEERAALRAGLDDFKNGQVEDLSQVRSASKRRKK
ncbi:MAG: hypothetical protein WCA19_11440 [Candidatus Acidiferrales bacterium]